MKLFSAPIILLAIICFLGLSCSKNDTEEFNPPEQEVLVDNQDSLLGRLIVNVMYEDSWGELKMAPENTHVLLFTNSYNLENNLPFYEFYMDGLNYTIDMGFLPPDEDYYILAHKSIGKKDYEGIKSAIVVQNAEVSVNVIMYIITP